MSNTMSNVALHAASLGIIAFVALFPSPDRLRQAIIPEQTTAAIEPFSPDTMVVKSTAYDDTTVAVTAPFPLNCTKTHNPDQMLGRCASQIVHYIATTKSSIPARRLEDGHPNPEYEQARRALVEICRLRWAMTNPPPDQSTDLACAALRRGG